MQVSDADIDHIGEGFSSDFSSFVKGIIKMKARKGRVTRKT